MNRSLYNRSPTIPSPKSKPAAAAAASAGSSSSSSTSDKKKKRQQQSDASAPAEQQQQQQNSQPVPKKLDFESKEEFPPQEVSPSIIDNAKMRRKSIHNTPADAPPGMFFFLLWLWWAAGGEVGVGRFIDLKHNLKPAAIGGGPTVVTSLLLFLCGDLDGFRQRAFLFYGEAFIFGVGRF